MGFMVKKNRLLKSEGCYRYLSKTDMVVNQGYNANPAFTRMLMEIMNSHDGS